jgi:hypothetical protein
MAGPQRRRECLEGAEAHHGRAGAGAETTGEQPERTPEDWGHTRGMLR